MATSSGNSATSSEGDVKQVMMIDERKRKRMQSNRESARRSRMRKQQHVDDLTAQIAQLRRENDRILSSINLTSQQFVSVEADNSVLRAQMSELSQRLDSLNQMVNYINTLSGVGVGNSLEDDGLGLFGHCMDGFGDFNGFKDDYNINNFVNINNNSNPWNQVYFGQSGMASADVLQPSVLIN